MQKTKIAIDWWFRSIQQFSRTEQTWWVKVEHNRQSNVSVSPLLPANKWDASKHLKFVFFSLQFTCTQIACMQRNLTLGWTHAVICLSHRPSHAKKWAARMINGLNVCVCAVWGCKRNRRRSKFHKYVFAFQGETNDCMLPSIFLFRLIHKHMHPPPFNHSEEREFVNILDGEKKNCLHSTG